MLLRGVRQKFPVVRSWDATKWRLFAEEWPFWTRPQPYPAGILGCLASDPVSNLTDDTDGRSLAMILRADCEA